jgi:histone H3/H4
VVAAEHERRRLAVAADIVLTRARRSAGPGERVRVTVTDVQREAVEQFALTVPDAAAALALRHHLKLTGAFGVDTDAFDDRPPADR